MPEGRCQPTQPARQGRYHEIFFFGMSLVVVTNAHSRAICRFVGSPAGGPSERGCLAFEHLVIRSNLLLQAGQRQRFDSDDLGIGPGRRREDRSLLHRRDRSVDTACRIDGGLEHLGVFVNRPSALWAFSACPSAHRDSPRATPGSRPRKQCAPPVLGTSSPLESSPCKPARHTTGRTLSPPSN